MGRAIFRMLVVCAAAAAQASQDVQTVEIDGRLVTYTIADGFAVIEGDIILGRAEDVENFRKGQAAGERSARPRSIYSLGTGNVRLWPAATMYYTMEPDVPVQQNLLAAIDYWNNVAPFKILPRATEPNYVTFRRIAVDAACSSSVGMVGGQQFIGVTASCSVGAAIHELGHAWGLLHEQSRADRDGHVTVLTDSIDKRFVSNFFQSSSAVDAGFYDYDSIMHYGPTGFSRDFSDSIATVPPGIPIGQRSGLSAGDIDAITRVYGVSPAETTIATTPSGLSVIVDGERVTTPRKFAWTRGSQHTVSVPLTQGTSPRYVFAKWSDGGEATHTIVASAERTVFAAHFQRQYPLSFGVLSGSGTASMTPMPVDGYMADRQPFTVKAEPDGANQFIRWTGSVALGSAGKSVSATTATVQLNGGAGNYQATFTEAPLHVVDSQPRGATVTVDGVAYLTPVRFSWTEGSTHALNFPSPQMRGNSTHRFTMMGWEDGTSGARTVTATAEGATYTATLLEEFLLTRATAGNGAIQVSPPSSDGFYEAGSTVNLTAVPGTGVALRYWVGDAAGQSLTQSVVMSEQRYVVANFGSAYPWLMLHAGSFTINQNPGTIAMAVAPGEIVSILGENIGPASAQSGSPDGSGRFPTAINGVSVTFDGIAAPITYASANQLNVVVPYALAGRASTSVSVRSPRGPLNIAINVAETMPGLFTADGSGRGPVAALNEDGSINSASNPAAPGSVVVLYGTGAGVLERAFADGQVMPAELVSPRAPVQVRFDRLAGRILYGGAAPSLVNGALQVNVEVPRDLPGGGEVPVRLVTGSYSSRPGTTIWVK